MQDSKCKMQSAKFGGINDRLLEFALNVVAWTEGTRRTFEGRHIGLQLFRASTSAGANYEEACAAESRPDFIHKLQTVLKELRESRYWIRLLSRIRNLAPAEGMDSCLRECEELMRIIAKSIITAKQTSHK